MTEEKWDAVNYFTDMLDHLVSERQVHRTRVGQRLLRLYGCAACRRVWHLIPEGPFRKAVEVAEAFADRVGTKADLKEALRLAGPGLQRGPTAAHRSAEQAVFCAADEGARRAGHAGMHASYALHNGWTENDGDFCLLLRDLFGNPFRSPVAFAKRWRTETVVSLATGIYADRAFDRMPILADALEEAGCDHPEVLTHCRSAGPHARGCWVVDEVLGKR